MNKKRHPETGTVREGLRARIATARDKQKSDIVQLQDRRKQLVEVAKWAADPEARNQARMKIGDLDEVIGRLTRELRRMRKRDLINVIDRLDEGALVSQKSGNLPKVNWAKPYRG